MPGLRPGWCHTWRRAPRIPARPTVATRRFRTGPPVARARAGCPGATGAGRGARRPAAGRPTTGRPTTGGAPSERARCTAPGATPATRWRRWVLIALAVVVALLLGYVIWLWSSYSAIERVDLDDVLDPVSGDTTNYLLVGSDSRENLDPEAPSGEESTVTGRRADTIILLQVGPDGTLMMSIPRDLWVTDPATGDEGRVNGTYNRGSGQSGGRGAAEPERARQPLRGGGFRLLRRGHRRGRRA